MNENKRNSNSRSQIPTAPYPPLRPSPNAHNNLNASTHSRHYNTGMNLNDNVIFTSNLSPRSSPVHGKFTSSIIPLQPPPVLLDTALPNNKFHPSISGYSGGGGGSSSTGSKLTNKKVSEKRIKKNQSAIAKFASSLLYQNIYGCINCEPHENTIEHLENDNKMMTNEVPNLLEIRQLERLRDPKDGNYYSRSRLLAVSRGTPDTAGILSTCMSFRPSTSITSDNQNLGSSLTQMNLDSKNDTFFVATGLNNGALCLHTISNVNDIISSPKYQSPVLNYYYSNRLHRPATSVAWAPSSPSQRSSNLVAIGLQSNAYTTNKRSNRSSDREACCLVWDMEHHANNATTLAGISNTNIHPGISFSTGNTSNTMGGFNSTQVVHPSGKYVHHSGVSSIAWLPHLSSISGPGQTLLVGCQSRQIQLYDLRITGGASHSPPISFIAHSDAVNGIQVDPNRPYLFASFCSKDPSPIHNPNTAYPASNTNLTHNVFDPIKLWDIRKLEKEKPVGEIKLNHDQNGTIYDIAWNTQSNGILVVAIGNTIRYFDTLTSITRPTLTQITHCDEPIGSIAFPSKYKNSSFDETSPLDFRIPTRMLAVSKRGRIDDLPTFQLAPLSISSRDGRIAHTLGKVLWIGNTTDGATSMENLDYKENEDISATMMRRARCLHAARYSTDAAANLQMLSEEESIPPSFTQKEEPILERSELLPRFNNREALWRLWNWIERVEMLCMERDDEPNKAPSSNTNSHPLNGVWTANGLIDAGVLSLLKMDKDEDKYDMKSFSEILGCDIFDSPMRCATLITCGWVSQFGLHKILADCEAIHHFERSAALAVFHGELGLAVATLQRGAQAFTAAIEEDQGQKNKEISSQYTETLQLVAMCIAGYNGSNQNIDPSKNICRYSCEGLLRRPEIMQQNSSGGAPYLRAICTFLFNIGSPDENWHEKILQDKCLSFCDRVAFACRFLTRNALRTFIDKCIHDCMNNGNVEGIVITGLGKQGIRLLQAYVDQYSDIQTAALVSSRVILPSTWTREREACSEWLDSYRDLLNTWQMWQSRAMFDVGRGDLLRHLVKRQQSRKDRQNLNRQSSNTRRVGMTTMKKQSSSYSNNISKQNEMNSLVSKSPPQVYARCNYCNAALPLNKLRRQEGMTNSWLSRQKPVLSSCPQCKKPLPRCCVCLLPLGCLNPYLELKRERHKAFQSTSYYSPVGLSSQSHSTYGLLDDEGDLSGLTNLPFAEWWSWCMSCKHGGHAHHLVGWFSNHDTCPVSNCNCRCQFDGIQKLNRPALKG